MPSYAFFQAQPEVMENQGLNRNFYLSKRHRSRDVRDSPSARSATDRNAFPFNYLCTYGDFLC